MPVNMVVVMMVVTWFRSENKVVCKDYISGFIAHPNLTHAGQHKKCFQYRPPSRLE